MILGEAGAEAEGEAETEILGAGGTSKRAEGMERISRYSLFCESNNNCDCLLRCQSLQVYLRHLETGHCKHAQEWGLRQAAVPSLGHLNLTPYIVMFTCHNEIINHVDVSLAQRISCLSKACHRAFWQHLPTALWLRRVEGVAVGGVEAGGGLMTRQMPRLRES